MWFGCNKEGIGMIKIGICNSQKSDRAVIKKYCERYFSQHFFEYELQEFTSGESFLESDFPDILFLEFALKAMSGLFVKEILEMKRADSRIVFVSSTKEDMEKAFGRNVYGFLLKPLRFESIAEMLTQIVVDVEEEKNAIFCKTAKEFVKIYPRDIMYVKSYGRYTKIYMRGDNAYKLSDKCIGDWCGETKLSDFASCHRCYVINLNYVKQVSGDVELVNGEKIPISKSTREHFRKSFEEFIWRNSYG